MLNYSKNHIGGVFVMAKPVKESPGKAVGTVTHYFSNISVAIIKVSAAIKVGGKIRIKGHTTDFEQEIESMQVDHKDVKNAKKGDDIGMKVADHVREHDIVYKI